MTKISGPGDDGAHQRAVEIDGTQATGSAGRHRPSPLLVLQARAEARAILFAACEYDHLEAAVVPVLQHAIDSGITDQLGAERAFAIIKSAFAGVADL